MDDDLSVTNTPVIEQDKKELTFRDVAFKPSQTGEMISNVVPEENYSTDDFEEYSFEENCDAQHGHQSLYTNQYGYELLNPETLTIHRREDVIDARGELDALIGLSELKKQIKDIEFRIAFEQKRASLSLQNKSASNHFIFSGNPGTGKNEVARLLGSIFYEIGVLSKGDVIEVDRSDLVMGWVGQSDIKTREIIQEAQGNILFIDEAYSLANNSNIDFGHEVIADQKELKTIKDKLISFKPKSKN